MANVPRGAGDHDPAVGEDDGSAVADLFFKGGPGTDVCTGHFWLWIRLKAEVDDDAVVK